MDFIRLIGHMRVAYVYLFLAGIVIKLASYVFLLGWYLV